MSKELEELAEQLVTNALAEPKHPDEVLRILARPRRGRPPATEHAKDARVFAAHCEACPPQPGAERSSLNRDLIEGLKPQIAEDHLASMEYGRRVAAVKPHVLEGRGNDRTERIATLARWLRHSPERQALSAKELADKVKREHPGWFPDTSPQTLRKDIAEAKGRLTGTPQGNRQGT